MTEKKKSPAKLVLNVLRFALPVALFAWLIGTGRLNLAELARLRPSGWIAAVFLVHVAMFLLAQLRWGILARARGLKISAGGVLRMGILGYCANFVIPGGLGYDGIRAAYLVTGNPEAKAAALTTPFVDRILGMLVLFILGPVNCLLLLSFGVEGDTSKLRALIGLCALALVGTIVGMIVLCSRRASVVLGPLRKIDKVEKLLVAMRELRSHVRVFALMLVISLAMHLLNCVGFYAAFQALDYSAPFLWVLALRPILIVVASLPIAPMGGLGVTDALAEELFALCDTTGGAEVLLFWRLVMMVLSLGFALLVSAMGITAPPAEAAAGETASQAAGTSQAG